MYSQVQCQREHSILSHKDSSDARSCVFYPKAHLATQGLTSFVTENCYHTRNTGFQEDLFSSTACVAKDL